MGQLHAQLSAAEQSHSIRGEDLHHPLGLFRGDGVLTLFIGLTLCSPSAHHLPSTRVAGKSVHVQCALTRWRTAPSQRWSPKISAWSFIPATQSCQPLAPSGIFSARAASGLPRGKQNSFRWDTFYLQILWVNTDGKSYLVVLSNRVTGVYEITLCHVADNGSPGEAEVIEDDRQIYYIGIFPKISLFLSFLRHAASSQACAGHLGGIRPRGGEPGRVATTQRQSDSGPPVGAGEAQLTARGQFEQ